MTLMRRRVRMSKYIAQVNTVGANVSFGVADREGASDTSQAQVAAVQRFLPS